MAWSYGLVLVLLLISLTSHAQTFEDAVAAHDRQDYATASRIWENLALRGHMLSQYNLALLYENGLGFERRTDIAAFWYRLAAMQDDVASQYNLGGLYYSGDGVPQILSEAQMWWTRAANQGDAPSLYNLAVMLIDEADQNNLHTIVSYLETAFELGHYEAGVLLSQVRPLLRDPSEVFAVATQSSQPNTSQSQSSTNNDTNQEVKEEIPSKETPETAFNQALFVRAEPKDNYSIEIARFGSRKQAEQLVEQWQLTGKGTVLKVDKTLLIPKLGFRIYNGSFKSRKEARGYANTLYELAKERQLHIRVISFKRIIKLLEP
ncbi:MAG: TPR repeat protein [Parasphingorhabdus sp.]|jgi:TPR repeat protein